jgi:hypothetical protein
MMQWDFMIFLRSLAILLHIIRELQLTTDRQLCHTDLANQDKEILAAAEVAATTLALATMQMAEAEARVLL